ncbi:YheC/YheD family endospore coat-associated protein [Desertibacillus haloalkaliphilus]|uniref:YheC/YheD family endospore coat-associated protein n=1 Tax=Desertibacillus haloalkaliphilus TaxID=1328930 RepID=UPI001C270D29|nr:YheC/YheD family protein [Desertibacillus haloalkaliphilus]MBU8905426.1 YheC/YheD family protein [Desertibacillus haloalkaliphilus]
MYYNPQTKQWGHQLSEETIVWGKNNQPLAKITDSSPSMYSFRVIAKHRKIGPVIGILTSEHNRKPFAGNQKTFLRIHVALQKKGGIVFIFTPNCVSNGGVDGYFYHPQAKSWVKGSFPYPDLIYNRIPTPQEEQTTSMKKTFTWIKQNKIPYFNPHFFNKWDTFKQLSKHTWLQQFLPETELLTSKKQLSAWLRNGHSVYLKPAHGHKGLGICSLSRRSQRQFCYQDQQLKQTFSSFQELYDFLLPKLKQRNYILQEYIHLNQYHGKTYDFRVHVQRVQRTWSVTGIGVRCAPEGGLTTHVPRGGSILSLHQITPMLNKQRLHMLAITTAKTLEKAYGRLGELSLDVGRDKQGHLWILEANSKPMVFDEQSIKRKGIETLIQTFYGDSGFRWESDDDEYSDNNS